MADALIFDDDPYITSLMADILGGLGLQVKTFPDGNNALLHIRNEQPRLLLLDLMMPGLDGIAICMMVRNDPKIAATKVVIVTGKSFPEDRDKALKSAGADLFIEKPFVVKDFAAAISALLKGQHALAAAPPAPSWTLKVWGQGEPGCVSVECGDSLFVLDAGKALGRLVADRRRWASAKQIWLLISHYHIGHVAGLAQAAEWVRAGVPLRVAGPRDSVLALYDLIEQELALPAEELRRKVQCYEMSEGGVVPDCPLRVETLAMMHPGPTLAYKLEGGGRRVVFAPDNELKRGWEEAMTGSVEKLAGFAKGAELLIHDARYSDADYPSFALQGHSSPGAALRLAMRGAVERLMFYHVDPKYDEAARRALMSEAKAAAAKEKGAPECLLASDGLEVKLG